MHKTEPVSPVVGCAFGPFVVDFVRRLAWRDAGPLPLTGKSFEILAFLIANRDHVVTKDDLLKEIWPDTFVQENNVVRHVSTLRKTLGQKPEEHDYILTVQGRGYRFVAPVAELTVLPADLAGTYNGTGTPTETELPVPLEEPVVTSRRSGPRWWGSTLAVAAVGVLAVAWLYMASTMPTAEARVLRPFTYGPNRHLAPTWSADGQSLAFASDRDGNFDVFVQRVNQSDPIRLTTSTSVDWQPAWSPDGKWVAFRSERDGGGIYAIPSGGGVERRLSTFGFEPRWSPDGSQILFTTSQYRRPRPLPYLVGLDGGTPRPVLAALAAELQGLSVGWHPDGRISVAGTDDGRWVFTTLTADGTNAVRSEESSAQASDREAQDLSFDRFVWAPDGRHVYFEGLSHGVRNLWRAEIDRATLAWKGRFERLTTGGGMDGGIAISPDGHRLAFEARTERTRIWSLPLSADGRVSEAGVPVTPGAPGEFDAAVSRDGLQLVYRTVRDGRQELWQHSIADGRERRLLADSGALRSSPRWSPDGASLVYLVSGKGQAAEPGQASLAIMSTADGGERLLRTFDSHELVPDDWSADGQSILGQCRSSDPSRNGICVASIRAGHVRLLAAGRPLPLHNARFSPNQRWISFTASDAAAGRSTVYVRSIDVGPTTAITDGLAFEDKAHWAPDGRALYFVSSRGGFLNVWGRRVDPETGRPVGDIFQATQFDGLRQAFAPDLRSVDFAITPTRLFVPVTEMSGQLWILDDVDR